MNSTGKLFSERFVVDFNVFKRLRFLCGNTRNDIFGKRVVVKLRSDRRGSRFGINRLRFLRGDAFRYFAGKRVQIDLSVRGYYFAFGNIFGNKGSDVFGRNALLNGNTRNNVVCKKFVIDGVFGKGNLFGNPFGKRVIIKLRSDRRGSSFGIGVNFSLGQRYLFGNLACKLIIVELNFGSLRKYYLLGYFSRYVIG